MDVEGAQAVITVERVRNAWRDVLRGYAVLIDDVRVGSLENGMTQRFLVEPGKHSVQMKIDWCSSPSIDVNVAAGHEEKFQCGPNGNPLLAFYFITLGRKKYVRLERATRL